MSFVSTLSGPPLLAFAGGIGWAVIVSICQQLADTEPINRYYVGYFLVLGGGTIPPYLLDSAGLPTVYSLPGLFFTIILYMAVKHLLSPETARISIT